MTRCSVFGATTLGGAALSHAALGLIAVLAFALPATAQAKRPGKQSYKQTGSRRPYTHHVELKSADGRSIDPTDPAAKPYSTIQTCKKCHDTDAIAHGFHFNAASTDTHGRAGEPWILTDPRTATQLPVSYRGFPGTHKPDSVGLSPELFVQAFGRHLSGGTQSYAGTDPEATRSKLVGELEIDCMFCHAANNSFSHSTWSKQIQSHNLGWASTAALGLAKITGSAKGLPADLDPTSDAGKKRLPKVSYDPNRFDAEGHVFFDIVRKPTNASCYACHSNQAVGEGSTPRWLHDDDIHLRAGMLCVDCHRNGIEHHTVRGFDGETHPSGAAVETLSCRGCHMDSTDGHGKVIARGGRLGAPKPHHKGLPPLHLDKLACTACHSGARSLATSHDVQTARAHGLDLPSQTRSAADLPYIVESVLARSEDGLIRPHRAHWPSFWGYLQDDKITAIAPTEAWKSLRRALRVRKDMRAEIDKLKLSSKAKKAILGDRAKAKDLTEAEQTEIDKALSKLRLETWHEKLAKGFAALEKVAPAADNPADDTAVSKGRVAVFVSGGQVFRKAAEGDSIETFSHSAAEPYLWPIAHDVRPARDATGASSCKECHSADAAFLHSTVSARGPVPTSEPITRSMVDTIGLDTELMATWDITFQARGPSKWVQIGALGIVSLVVLVILLGALIRLLASRPKPGSEEN